MRTKKRTGPLPPIKVRHEPPTLDEAFFAAAGLADDPEAQIEIAAGFMGVSTDEARAALRRQRREPAPIRVGDARGTGRTVVIERRAPRRVIHRP